jgi:hypothetical protein
MADQIFSIANLVALSGWVLLILLPRRAWVTRVVIVAIVLLFALSYAGIIGARWAGRSGGFSSLPAVAALFADPWLLLAGWIHYLAFDLLVGRWEAIDARERGIPHLAVVPCLFLTFMFGPAGWLAYMALRAVHARVMHRPFSARPQPV